MGDFLIPSSLFDLHEEACDDMMTSLGVQCTLQFAPRTVAGGVQNNPIGQKGSNVSSFGGPIVVPNGNTEEGAEGTLEQIITQLITLRVFWEPQSWVKVPVPVNLPAGSVQTIGFMSDLPKILQAHTCIINSPIEPIMQLTYKLFGQPIPHGFRMNRYFIAYWELI